jgi:hypothetical protein
MADETLEGWAPGVRDGRELAEVIERAFDYRGDVTLVLSSGAELTGYLYNRDRDAAEPFVQVYDPAGAAHTLRYADIATVRFTGKDPAAGKSYEAWLERRAPRGV